jgi:opacity protein-like surface antigen
MRGAIKVLVLTAAVALLATPNAFADGYVSPWGGVNFGAGSSIDNGRGAFGVDAGWMGGGVIGGEFDFGYSPSFFGNSNDFGNNTVMDLMANVIVGIPVGGQHGAGVRPYVTGGVGLIRSQIDGGTLFDVSQSNNDFGFNLGAGVMGYVAEHFGLRGDVRYFRSTNDNLENLGLGRLKFWRVSAGVVIR